MPSVHPFGLIHLPLDEHPALFRNVAFWLRPGGYFLAIVGHDAWTGAESSYLGVEGAEMRWSHPDETTTLRWIEDSGLRVLWKEFIPEGKAGHTLVLAQRSARSRTVRIGTARPMLPFHVDAAQTRPAT